MKLVMTLVANIDTGSVSPICCNGNNFVTKEDKPLCALILQTLEDQKRKSNFVPCFCKHNKN